MSPTVRIRPLRPGELAEARDPESEFDDFGPRPGYQTPHPCRLEENGALGIEADDALGGVVSWIWVHWGPGGGSRNPMIGIWLDPAFRGRGIGTEAQRQLVDLMFRHTTVNRVEAHTDVENVAEQRALERVGFTREGLVRGAQWRNAAYHDGYLYSVLRADWTARTGEADRAEEADRPG
jgi:RimJ/RimL family protein N-acetyltransferase